MKKYIIPLIFLFPLLSLAQSKSLGLVTKVESGKVILRWMPLDYDTWQKGNQKGYNLYRYQVADSAGTVYRLNEAAIKPLPLDMWKTNSSYAQVVQKIMEQPIPSDSIQQNLYLALALQMSNMEPEIAEAMGMYYEDSSISSSQGYAYLLILDDDNLAFTDQIIKPEEFTDLKAPQLLESDYQDSVFFFKWKITEPVLQSAFIVEMSENSMMTWKPTTEAPILASDETDQAGNTLVSYLFKAPKFYHPYYFRVRAITPFGQLSEPSDTTYLYAYRDRLPQTELKHRIISNEQVELSWAFPDSLNFDIRGFALFRSNWPDSAFVEYKRLNRELRSYIDKEPLTEAYYRLAVADWEGNNHFSLVEFVQFEDFEAPAKPLWKTHEINKEGIVKLTWSSNSEKDFAGYSLFYADAPDSEFSLLTQSLIRDSVFIDTLALNILNKRVYYTLVAYDIRLNPSVHADTLVVIRPDTIAPAPANFLDYRLTDSTIYLAWANSPSLDLEYTLLTRRANEDSLACILALFPPESRITEFTDNSAEEGKEYEFALLPKDYANLWGEPAEIKLATTFSGIRRAISKLEFVYEPEAKKVQLYWEIPKRKVKRYTLYRQGPEDNYMAVYKVFTGEFGSFIDPQIKSEKPYQYRISAFFEDGSKTALSPTFIAVLPNPDKK